jgi:hypothetical protein
VIDAERGVQHRGASQNTLDPRALIRPAKTLAIAG